MDKKVLTNETAFTLKDYVRGVIPGTDFIVDDIIMELHMGIKKYKIVNVKLNHLLLRILGAYGLGKESDWSNVIKNHPRSYEIILKAIKELEEYKLVRFNKENNSVALTKLGEVIAISFQLELTDVTNTIRAQYAEVEKEYMAIQAKMKKIVDNDTKIYIYKRHMCDRAYNDDQGYVVKPLGKTTIKNDQGCMAGARVIGTRKTTVKNEPDKMRKAKDLDVVATLMKVNRSCSSLQFAISDLMLSSLDAASEHRDEDIARYLDVIHEVTGNIIDSEKIIREFVTDSNHCA